MTQPSYHCARRTISPFGSLFQITLSEGRSGGEARSPVAGRKAGPTPCSFVGFLGVKTPLRSENECIGTHLEDSIEIGVVLLSCAEMKNPTLVVLSLNQKVVEITERFRSEMR